MLKRVTWVSSGVFWQSWPPAQASLFNLANSTRYSSSGLVYPSELYQV